MADNQPNIAETKPDRLKQQPVDDAGRQNDATAEKRPSFIRRHPFSILLGIVVLLALIVAAWFVWKIYFHPYESTDDAFVDARSFSVAAKVSGYVAEVPVTDNQSVKAGDVILRIDPRDYQIALDQANGQVEVAKASVDSAGAQIEAASAAVDVAKAQQNSATAALQFAQQESNRQQQLVKTGSGSVQAVQQATATLQQDQASLAQMQANIISAQKNKAVAEAQKSSALASLKQAQAQAEEAQQNLSYTTITAAQPGRIVRLAGAKGQYVEAGQAISTFVPDDVWITANFKETQLTDMRPGQPVDITIDAYPNHTLHGKVASVQPGSGTAFSLLPAENATGNYVKVTQRVPVKIIVDRWPADVAIGPGMSVVPTVTVRPRS
ncbi:HlyD family secretion protein [Rhizobium sp. CNPSo 4062]|uniref:HlyD family secretion protein n=1 Tax=Rhizobium sp. CNPSo 4062 TaxID=3021410 RepID=UPI00254BEF64|nr:HlyD family secretion protein [Rhizobium sp. CNPSo 4062]MDK4701776.1 HlyD family secretion protein [Rhizobium sp. CNPSo 4062]